jgi:cysteine desulfurase
MEAPVKEAVLDAMDRLWGNPNSLHRLGRMASVAMEEARIAVADLVDADPKGVRFTSGATESNAWVFSACCSTDRPLALVSAVEHPSALGWGSDFIPVNRDGVVDLDALEDLLETLAPRLGVVSVMAANNETGAIQPIEAVSSLCRSYGVPFHCDAAQVMGRLKMPIPADFITLSAHKFGGPKGIGALVLRKELEPLLRGGPQERGSRAGTSSVPAIVGMGVAAQRCDVYSPGPRDRLDAHCLRLGGQVLAEGAPRLPNTTSILFPHPGDLLVMALDMRGVQASTGSACSSGANRQSHVLTAMGVDGAPVRFSMGIRSDVGYAIEQLDEIFSDWGDECVL